MGGHRCMAVVMIWNDVPICGLITNIVSSKRQDFTLVTNEIKIDKKLVEKYFYKLPKIISFEQDIESQISIENIRLVFVPGWSFRKINSFVNSKRSSNLQIILMADNNFRVTLKKLIGAIYFRLFLKWRYDAVLVPGISGAKLMRLYGFKNTRIFKGMYGASEEIFFSTQPINHRSKKFLFVGQLIKRKSIEEIVHAYHKYLNRGGTWGLTIVGSGPLKNKLDFSNIDYVGFKNPEEVTAIMNDSSCLILVSKVEHWGTVAVEAMACGLPLIISRNVGSFDDLYCNNGVSLDRPSQNLISDAMAQMETLSVDQLSRMSELSIERSTKFNSFSYSNLIEKIIDSRGIH